MVYCDRNIYKFKILYAEELFRFIEGFVQFDPFNTTHKIKLKHNNIVLNDQYTQQSYENICYFYDYFIKDKLLEAEVIHPTKTHNMFVGNIFTEEGDNFTDILVREELFVTYKYPSNPQYRYHKV